MAAQLSDWRADWEKQNVVLLQKAQEQTAEVPGRDSEEPLQFGPGPSFGGGTTDGIPRPAETH